MVGQHHSGGGGGSPGTLVLSLRLSSLSVPLKSLSIPRGFYHQLPLPSDRQDLALPERGLQTTLWPLLGSKLEEMGEWAGSVVKPAATLEVLISCTEYYISYGSSNARKRDPVQAGSHKREFLLAYIPRMSFDLAVQ